MANREDRIHILRMIEDGKLTAAQGLQLLEVLNAPTATQPTPVEPPASPLSGRMRFLVVRVTDLDSSRVRVNIRLPVNVVTAGIKIGARFSPQVEGLDLGTVMAYIQSGQTGLVLDVVDDKDGEHVEVFIE
jgi:hypothetical protein